METYELFLDEETKEKGVFAISLVSDPAIESDWIALSKDVKMAVVDDEKHILMGAALIPNKLIPRKDKSGIFIASCVVTDKAKRKWLKFVKDSAKKLKTNEKLFIS